MGSRSTRVLLTVVLAMAASAAVWAASAGAGTPTQIGATGTGADCSTGNWVQESVAMAPSYTVPSAGVITSWSHRAQGSAPGKGGLQVWRSAGGTSYTLIGGSDVKTFSAGALNTFAINLPVSAGDDQWSQSRKLPALEQMGRRKDGSLRLKPPVPGSCQSSPTPNTQRSKEDCNDDRDAGAETPTHSHEGNGVLTEKPDHGHDQHDQQATSAEQEAKGSAEA